MEIGNSLTQLIARREDRATPFHSDSEEDAADASSDLEETRWRREGDGGEETTMKERGGGKARVVRVVATAAPNVELGFGVLGGGIHR
jgi:hypothetical protein